jgi:small subunit ribosomal protein S17
MTAKTGNTEPRRQRRLIVGTVVSTKVDRSVVVSVGSRRKHPMYKKYFGNMKRYLAHDEKKDAKPGDLVEIAECRPLSARKRFRLSKILKRGTDVTVEIADETAAGSTT